MIIINTINSCQNICAIFMMKYDNVAYFNDDINIKLFKSTKHISMKTLLKSQLYNINTFDFITLLSRHKLISNIKLCPNELNKFKDILLDKSEIIPSINDQSFLNNNIVLSKIILDYLLLTNDNTFQIDYSNFNDNFDDCDIQLDFSYIKDISDVIYELHKYSSLKLPILIHYLDYFNKFICISIYIIFIIITIIICTKIM